MSRSEVAVDDMPAFYGRLRVLRGRAGVPLASNPGKGRRSQSSELDLWETHLALRLAEAGFRHIASVCSSAGGCAWRMYFNRSESEA